MSKSRNLPKCRICLLFGLCLVVAGESWGQSSRGGFSAEGFFDRLDQNGDGRLDANELQRLQGPFREALEDAGVDFRRGVDLRGFERAFDEMRRRREEEGGGFGRGGYDRGRSESDARESSRGEGSSDRSRSTRRSSEPSKPEPKPRVTVDLPSAYVEADLNGDGQVSFFEWRQWKRGSIAEFMALDHNGDGFLTPRELQKGPSEILPAEGGSFSLARPSNSSPPSSPTLSPAAQSTRTSGRISSTRGGPRPTTSSSTTTSTAGSATGASSGTPAGELEGAAERMFRLLDQNRDGAVDSTEWQRSDRIKPMFENAGVDLGKPMSREEFVSHYVRLSKSGP